MLPVIPFFSFNIACLIFWGGGRAPPLALHGMEFAQTLQVERVRLKQC